MAADAKQVWAQVLAGSLLAACVVLVVGPGCSSGDSSESAGSLTADASGDDDPLIHGKLDPEAFREQIEELEAALYIDRPETTEDFERVGAAVLSLVNVIGHLDPVPIGREASGTLLFFSARAQTGHVDPRIGSLGPLRQEWGKLRERFFAPASWYRQPLSADSATRFSTGDPRALAAAAGVIEELDKLLTRGRLEVIALGEPTYTLEHVDATGQAQIDRWRDWAAGWNERLKQATASLPAYPGSTGPSDLIAVLEHVDMAVLHLERVDRGEGRWATPFRREWEQKFVRAQQALEDARRQLAGNSQSAG